VVRTEGDPRALGAPIGHALRSIDPAQSESAKTMDQLLSDSVAQPRFYGLLLSSFAGWHWSWRSSASTGLFHIQSSSELTN